MSKTLCVYCSSSRILEQHYYDMARRLGTLMAEADFDLVYGAGNMGLMVAVAEGVRNGGRRVTGVIPEKLRDLGLTWEKCDEVIVTPDLRQRKAIMEQRADGFIALPGGFGTFEEVLEVIALKQLQYHNKPIVILNYDHYYDRLADLFEEAYTRSVIKDQYRDVYEFADTPEEAIQRIIAYEPRSYGPLGEKVSAD